MMQSRERNIVSTSAGGGFVRQRDDIAAVLGVPPAMVRVVSGDVGGNFGIRNSTCPGFALVACAARRVGRPVKWTCERRDAFASDFHGRDLSSKAELALDKDGHFLALRAINIGNLSTSAISFVPLAKGIAVSSSVYDIACSYKRGRAVVTNTVPTSAYRSAGRPEVVFVLERLIDIACRRHGFDRLEIKRRNLVPPESNALPKLLGPLRQRRLPSLAMAGGRTSATRRIMLRDSRNRGPGRGRLRLLREPLHSTLAGGRHSATTFCSFLRRPLLSPARRLPQSGWRNRFPHLAISCS
jgi:CO/xanthine dehydrogenase Mo-binding subunit